MQAQNPSNSDTNKRAFHARKACHFDARSLKRAVIAERGVPLRDLGQEGIVVRWWSIPSRHRQPSFGAVSSAALLHLSADKIFLASLAVSGDLSDLTIEYLRHRRVLKIRNLLTVLRDRLVGKGAFLPRFTDQVRRR